MGEKKDFVCVVLYTLICGQVIDSLGNLNGGLIAAFIPSHGFPYHASDFHSFSKQADSSAGAEGAYTVSQVSLGGSVLCTLWVWVVCYLFPAICLPPVCSLLRLVLLQVHHHNHPGLTASIVLPQS